MSQPPPPLMPPSNIPPGLAAYYQTSQPVQVPPPATPPPSRRERLGWRLGLLIFAWSLIPIALITMIVIGLIASSAGTFKVGETVTATPWQLTVRSYKNEGKSLQWNNAGLKVDATNNWLTVEINLKNTGTQAGDISSGSFVVQDANGNTYPVSDRAEIYAYSAYKGAQSFSGNITPGATERTYLVYDVPADLKNPQLVFKQGTNPPIIKLEN